MTEIKKAVIPAAGLGIRFLPATKSQPKEMLPIIDKPVIHFVVEELVNSGIDDITIITGRGKRAIEDYFDYSPELSTHLKQSGQEHLLKPIDEILNNVSIHFMRQREPKGLGDAILYAEKHVGNEPFVVALGDTIVVSQTPATKQLIDLFHRYNSSIVAVEDVPKEEVSSYGVIDGVGVDEGIFQVKNMIEKPKPEEAPSTMSMLGRYILTPEIFNYLKQTQPGYKNEIQLTDALKLLLKSETIHAAKIEGKRYDIGNKIGYLTAIIEFALQRNDLGDVKAQLKKFL